MRELLKPVMRIALLLAVMVASASIAPAQEIDRNKQITLQSKSATRKAAIEQIESQTAYRVAYHRPVFNDNVVVDFGRTSIPLGNLLSRMLEGTDYTYTTDGNYIIIFHNNAQPDRAVVSVAAVRSVSGTITDSRTQGVHEGVLVEIVGQQGAKATSNTFGRFTITGVPAGIHIVKLTPADGGSVRYREVNVPADRDVDVALPMNEELIVTSPGTQKAPVARTETKTTAYFTPNVADHTIRAFSDEPKTDYSVIPSSQINDEYLPKVAVKSNLLYLATTTLNAGVEFGLAPKWTLDLSAAYNPFQLQKPGINLFWFVQPEARYWFCQRFEKHFIGLHGLYGRFNIGEVDFLTRTFEDHRYKGWGAGAGISYGYHLPMAKRWAWEFTVGVGYVYLEYDKFRCYECDEFVAKKNRHYFGPTKAGVSLIFMIK